MSRPVITLTTDFGLKDPYVAEMKGVILGISPKATIVDITHDVEKFNVRMGTFVLASIVPYFPRGTIHVAVVDPSVGTEGHPLLIQTKGGFLIGPDNGVLALAATNQGVEHVFRITNQKLMLSKPSNTFHGRDIFAPAAAHLANGVKAEEFGLEIHKIEKPRFVGIIKRDNVLIGEALYIDSFGNIITNFALEELGPLVIGTEIKAKIKRNKLKLKLCRAYAEERKTKPLAIIGSHGFLEISMNQSNAAEFLKIKEGDRITIYHV